MMPFSKSSGTFLLSLAILLMIMVSCKTTEKVVIQKARPMSSVRLYKKAEENTFDYLRFNIRRVNVQVEKGENRTSFRAGVQAVKDSAILISVSKMNILLARVKLTPDSVSYVNYLNKTYYSGGYETVSDLINFTIDFRTVQAIISANIFLLFDSQKELREFKTWVENDLYVLQSEAVRRLNRMENKGKTQRMERFIRRMGEDVHVVQTFYFHPDRFTIRKVVMDDQMNHQQAVLLFGEYEQVGGKYFPSSVVLNYDSEVNKLRINTKMSGFSTTAGEFIPLRIPAGYQRIF
jgi:uncharacterized protein YkuJ